MEISSATTWTYFTESVTTCVRACQLQQQTTDSTAFTEQLFALNHIPKTPLLLYVSHTSPWHLVLTIIPTSSKHVVGMKNGESLSIPVIVCLCDEPWIASNLASLERDRPIRKTSDARIKFAVSPLADLHTRTHDTAHQGFSCVYSNLGVLVHVLQNKCVNLVLFGFIGT